MEYTEAKQEDTGYDNLYKIVLMGESGVGKSNIVGRYTGDKFNPDIKTTIGVEFASRIVKLNGKRIKAQVWDTAGQERFKAITPMYYRGAAGALLVYDITDESSFEKCTAWLQQYVENNPANTPVLLVGNKSDLKKEREVPTKTAKQYAEKEGLFFIETSALTASNIDAAFQNILTEIGKRCLNVLEFNDAGDAVPLASSTPITLSSTEEEEGGGEGKSRKPGCAC